MVSFRAGSSQWNICRSNDSSLLRGRKSYQDCSFPWHTSLHQFIIHLDCTPTPSKGLNSSSVQLECFFPVLISTRPHSFLPSWKPQPWALEVSQLNWQEPILPLRARTTAICIFLILDSCFNRHIGHSWRYLGNPSPYSCMKVPSPRLTNPLN